MFVLSLAKATQPLISAGIDGSGAATYKLATTGGKLISQSFRKVVSTLDVCIDRSVTFYTTDLGFKLDRQNSPAFAQVSIGHLKLILAVPVLRGRG